MEDKCKKCGKCCHFRVENKQKTTMIVGRCVHLTKDNLCDIYETRHINKPSWCLMAEELKTRGGLPEGCGYI